MSNSRTKISSFLAVFAMFLASCSGNVFDLAVGDCFDDGDLAVGGEAEQIGDVPLVECDQAHDNEVYAEVSLEGEGFPGDNVVANEADAVCYDAFESFVGLDYESSELDFGWLVPTADSWDAGDRVITCFVYRLDLKKVTGTLRHSGI